MKVFQAEPNDESVEVDSIDLGILDLLQENCKQSLAQIGERVGLKASSVLERRDNGGPRKDSGSPYRREENAR